MKFTPGAMVGDLSGSIGSTTASRNKFGSYFRSKVIPVNPNTLRQQDVRANFTSFVTAWTESLTEPQRVDWRNWATQTTIQGKDGNPIHITGQNAYIRFNTARLQIGGTRVDDGPTTFNNGPPVTSFQSTLAGIVGDIGAVAGVFSVTANIAGGTLSDGDLSVFLGRPINASRVFFKGPYQFSTTEAADAAPATIAIDAVQADQEQEIPLLTDQFRAIRFRMIYDDGRLSEKFEALATVTADSI